MEHFLYNESAKTFDLDPRFLDDGLRYAKQHGYSVIRLIDLNESGKRIDVDFRSLSSADFVEALHIHDNFMVGDHELSEVYTLSALKKLVIGHKNIYLDPSRLPTLRSLIITSKGAFPSFEGFASLEELVVFELKNEDLGFLGKSRRLRTLQISGGKPASLTGLEGLDALEEIKLTRMPALRDALALNRLTSLRSVYFDSCKNLTDFSFLESNANVKDIFFAEALSLHFIKRLHGLKVLCAHSVRGTMRSTKPKRFRPWPSSGRWPPPSRLGRHRPAWLLRVRGLRLICRG